MVKKIISTLLAITLTIGLLPPFAQEAKASGTYQMSKAVEYALAHARDPESNDANGCAKFVSACLAAGGITVPNQFMYNRSDRVDPDYSGTIEEYSNPHTCARAMLKWLMEQGYSTVKRPSSGADIAWNEINVGDIVFMTSGSIYGHVVIITGRNPETGESLYSAHSCSRRDEPLGNRANYVVQLSKYSDGSASSLPAASTLSINTTTTPQGDHVPGAPFYFRGSITSNYPITAATVSIVRKHDSAVMQTKDVYPNKKTVDLLKDGLDSLKFGQLPVGSYTLHLTARDTSGQTKEWACDFTVGGGDPISTLEIDVTGLPASRHAQGKAVYLRGTISSNYTVTSSTVSVLSEKGSTVMTKTVAPNATSVDIQKDGLDSLKFGTLPAGSYVLKLSATDSSGKVVEKTTNFQVVRETAPVIYAVRFDMNGGNGFIETQTKTAGTSLKLSSRIPSRTGYSFLGWASSPNATSAQYMPGDTYTSDKAITLYAVWQKEQSETDKRADSYAGNAALAAGDVDVIDAIFMNLADYASRILVYEAENAVVDKIEDATGANIVILDVSSPESFLDGVSEEVLSKIPTYGSMLQRIYSYGKLTAKSLWDLGESLADANSARKKLLNASLIEAASHEETLINSVHAAYLAGIADYKKGTTQTAQEIESSYGHASQKSAGTAQRLRENASSIIFLFDRKSSRKLREAADAIEEFTNNLPDMADVYKMGYDIAEIRDSFEAPATGQGSLENFVETYSYRPGQFTDVPADIWCADNVEQVYRFGLMKGVSETYFDTKRSITVAQTIVVAARMHSIYMTGSDQFPVYDGGNWYDPYVDYARKHGIISGNYSMSSAATRGQFAQILSAALPGDDTLAELNSVSYEMIPDVSGDESYAPAVLRLYRAGVLNGSDAKGTFYGERTINRGQVAAILSRAAVPTLRMVKP